LLSRRLAYQTWSTAGWRGGLDGAGVMQPRAQVTREESSVGDPAATHVALLLLTRFPPVPGRRRAAATDQVPAQDADHQQGYRHGYPQAHGRSLRRSALFCTMRPIQPLGNAADPRSQPLER